MLKSQNVNQITENSSVDVSVAIVGLVTFVGDCARGILFPVLWPLCQSLGGTHVDYGEHLSF